METDHDQQDPSKKGFAMRVHITVGHVLWLGTVALAVPTNGLAALI